MVIFALMRLKQKFAILFFTLGLFTGGFAFAQVSDDTGIVTTDIDQSLPENESIDLLIKLTDSLITSYPDQSLVYARKALSLAESQNDDEGRLFAMRRIADIYWGKTDLTSALNYANTAKSLAQRLDNRNEYAEVNLIIGKVFADLGDYDKSSELNFEALKIFEKENDSIGIGNALSRIGSIYFDQEKFDKALEYYSLSLSIARENSDLIGVSRGLNNVAAVYANKNEFVNFEKNIKEAIQINKKTGRRLWEGINYLNLGIIHKDTGHLDTANFYIQKAISIFTELNNIPKLSVAYIIFSKYYSEIHNREKSLFFANEAYKLGKINKLKKTIYLAAQRLHEIYLEQGDIEDAYQYTIIEYEMKDTLQIEKSLTRLSQLEMIYKTEKLNRDQKHKQQIRNYIYLITAIVVVALFLLIIVVLVARHRIKVRNAIIAKKQLENELEMKNKELASNVMVLMRKNEILSEIADNLMEISDEAVRDEIKSAIQRIAGKLQKTDDNKLWEEFEIRFKQVHHNFYDKLNSQFPNLSPNEQKLCAFLRLNMTTKEISELTGQRTGTLEIARSRLRKKLGISNTRENLVSFLSQI
jgi:tetratricopeptide (TPR) repeat protein